MLEYLRLQNFRAFKDQRYDFARINLFVGPNNSGKSSALSAINLIAQTIKSSGEAGGILNLRGIYDDLGTFLDVIHGNNPRTPLGLEFKLGEFTYCYEFKYRPQRREIELKSFSLKSDDQVLYSYSTDKNGFSLKYLGRKHEYYAPTAAKRRPIFDGLAFRDRNLFDVRITSREVNAKFSKTTPEEYKKLQRLDATLLNARMQLRSEFRTFDSLSPFRDPPTRTFLFSGTSPSTVGRTGSNTIDLLVSDNFNRGRKKKDFVEKISNWLIATRMGRAIKVKPLTSRHYEICIVGHDGRDHNICDVGFGCSQVLPVLVGALNISNEMRDVSDYFKNLKFIVQEPEIHLHPNAQAELGEFLTQMFKKQGQVFVETHSPDLVIRIQKLVADGEINAADVKVFYIHGGTSPSKITPLQLNEFGFFKTKWPNGFFPQRQHESFMLAQSSTRAMQRGNKNTNKKD